MWKYAVQILGGMVMVVSSVVSARAGDIPVYELSVGEANISVISLTQKDLQAGILRAQSEEDREIIARAYPEGKVSNVLNVLLLRGRGVTALVDTGYDWTAGTLDAALARAGVGPQDVTHVVITHAHGDHTGGLLRDGKAAFPSAELLFSEKELAFWTDPGRKAAASGGMRNIFDNVSTLLQAYGDRVRTFVPGDPVVPELSGVLAVDESGHTPGHVGIMAEADGKTFLFWSDLLHAFDVQAHSPSISASFDMDPEKAARVRRDMLNRAGTEGWLVVGSHVPFTQPRVLTKSDK